MVLYAIIAKYFATREVVRTSSLLTIGFSLALAISGIIHPLFNNQADALARSEQATIAEAIRKGDFMKVTGMLDKHNDDITPTEAEKMLVEAVRTNGSLIAGIIVKECAKQFESSKYPHILEFAISEGHVYVVDSLLQNPRIEQNYNSYKDSLLLLAARSKRSEVVDYFLSKYQDSLNPEIVGEALEISVVQNDINTAQSFLVKHGATIDRLGEQHYVDKIDSSFPQYMRESIRVTDYYAARALGHAAKNGNLPLVKMLAGKLQGINISDKHAAIALQNAAQIGNYDIAVNIIGHYKNLITIEGKLKAFVAAANIGKESILKVLIQEIGQRNIPQHHQAISLQYAAQNGHKRTVNILLNTFGKQLSAEAIEKAHQHAIRNRKMEVAELISRYRA